MRWGKEHDIRPKSKCEVKAHYSYNAVHASLAMGDASSIAVIKMD